MDDHLDDQISGHYGWSGLMEAIADEIRGKGIDPERVTVAQLAPVDNYHWHRLAGTLALARVAKITADDRVLDVGGGIGGPARQLAHRLGSRYGARHHERVLRGRRDAHAVDPPGRLRVVRARQRP